MIEWMLDILLALPKDRVPPDRDDTFSPKFFFTVTRARGHQAASLLVPMEVLTTTSNCYDTSEDNASFKLLLDDPSLNSNPPTAPHPTTSPTLPQPTNLPSIHISLKTNLPDGIPD